jgi:nitrogenase molybdenum-iron protein NifN
MFDRLGAAHQVSVGYRGTRDLIFSIGNLFIAGIKEPDIDSWRPAGVVGDRVDAAATAH